MLYLSGFLSRWSEEALPRLRRRGKWVEPGVSSCISISIDLAGYWIYLRWGWVELPGIELNSYPPICRVNSLVLKHPGGPTVANTRVRLG